MFKWIDYETSSALFIDGIKINVAILKHKNFQLHDNATGYKIKMKSSCLDEAKIDAQNFLVAYWKNVQKEINQNLEALKETTNVK